MAGSRRVVKDGREVKIWLRDLTVAVNLGFSARDLNEIIDATREHRIAFMEAWNDYFGS